ncbi:hypothetical protein QEZ63_09910 [Alcaligenes faecalis]|jgi:hypothetical protein|nr:hypothetical protein QEZ63_09910 [Alcaligenes faecalis]
MKRIVVAVALLGTMGATFAGNADFTLVNKTGYAINEVFISPSQRDAWGEDRLGENQFMNGQSRQFKFGDTKNCEQDIKVIFTDDESEVQWDDINLCEVNKITLRYNRKSNEVSADLE